METLLETKAFPYIDSLIHAGFGGYFGNWHSGNVETLLVILARFRFLWFPSFDFVFSASGNHNPLLTFQLLCDL